MAESSRPCYYYYEVADELYRTAPVSSLPTVVSFFHKKGADQTNYELRRYIFTDNWISTDINQNLVVLIVNPELMAWFQAVDYDRSGRISANELQKALANGNCSQFSIEACKMLISLFDMDNSGTIDFNEFQQLFGFINQWRGAFQMYDKNNSQAIDNQELGQALLHMGYRLSMPTVDRVFRKFVTAGNNQITFDNFIVACIQLNKLTSNYFIIRNGESTELVCNGTLFSRRRFQKPRPARKRTGYFRIRRFFTNCSAVMQRKLNKSSSSICFYVSLTNKPE